MTDPEQVLCSHTLCEGTTEQPRETSSSIDGFKLNQGLLLLVISGKKKYKNYYQAARRNVTHFPLPCVIFVVFLVNLLYIYLVYNMYIYTGYIYFSVAASRICPLTMCYFCCLSCKPLVVTRHIIYINGVYIFLRSSLTHLLVDHVLFLLSFL